MSGSGTEEAAREGLDSNTRKVLGIAFLTVCLDLLGFGIIIPIQPFYAERFGATPTVVTLLGASYSLMQFLFAPFWGRLSDRIGRRPVILSSVAMGAVGYALFGLAGSLPMLFAARMLSGFGNANIATAQALIADVTTGADRAKGMGLIGAAFGLGFIIGPAIGGVLGQFGLAVPAFGAAALGLVNLGLAYRYLPETRKLREERAEGHGGGHKHMAPWSALRVFSGARNVVWIVLIFMIMTTGFALMEQALGLFIERVWVPEALTATTDAARDEALRKAARLTSYLLVVIGVTATIVQGGLIGRLSRTFGERVLIRVGLFGIALSMVLYAWVGSMGLYMLMLPVSVLLATSSGLATPSLNSLLSRSVGEAQQGTALGAGQSASALGRVFGPALSGVLFERAIGLPFHVGAALTIIALLLALVLQPPLSEQDTPKTTPETEPVS